MNKSIELIHDEHRALAAMLSAFRSLAGEIRAERQQADFGLFELMLRYIEKLPEKVHHPKENEFLFKKLRARCAEAVPVIEQLEDEHRQGEHRIAALRAALAAYQESGAAGFEPFYAVLASYIDSEWRHMNTEEKQVFPLAEAHLSAADWAEIEAAFLANDNPWQGAAGEYAGLFSRIVNTAPAPVGLGAPLK